MDDEAVSPVIGVILMVAITVVLGAVVFLLVGPLGDKNTDDAGTMVGQAQESQDQWKIIRGADRPQEQFSFFGDKVGARYAWNETATSASPLLTTTRIPMQGGAAWGAGAYLSVCADGIVPLSDLTVTFVNHETNGVVTTTRFATVAPCA